MSTLLSRPLKRLLLTGDNELKKRVVMQLNYHKITKQRFVPANHDGSLVHDRKCWHFEEISAHPAACTVCPFLSWSAPRGDPIQREPHDSLPQPSNTDEPKHHQLCPQIKSYATEMRGSVFYIDRFFFLPLFNNDWNRWFPNWKPNIYVYEKTVKA